MGQSRSLKSLGVKGDIKERKNQNKNAKKNRLLLPQFFADFRPRCPPFTSSTSRPTSPWPGASPNASRWGRAHRGSQRRRKGKGQNSLRHSKNHGDYLWTGLQTFSILQSLGGAAVVRPLRPQGGLGARGRGKDNGLQGEEDLESSFSLVFHSSIFHERTQAAGRVNLPTTLSAPPSAQEMTFTATEPSWQGERQAEPSSSGAERDPKERGGPTTYKSNSIQSRDSRTTR